MQEFWKVSYYDYDEVIVVKVLDSESGNFTVMERSNDQAALDNPAFTPHTYLDYVTEDDDGIPSSGNVHYIVGVDFHGWTRFEIERFISAMINHATNRMATFLHSEADVQEFIDEYCVKR